MTQVSGIFAPLKSEYTLRALVDEGTPRGREMKDFVEEIASTSDHIRSEVKQEEQTAQVTLLRDGHDLGITFKGVPGGHEFNTFLLALLNADGIGRNLPDEPIKRRIEGLDGSAALRTFVSLDCTNCPDVAQALNIVAIYNGDISNTIIDGGQFPSEADAMHVQAVPTVFDGEDVLTVGRSTLSELLGKLEERLGTKPKKAAVADTAPKRYDLLVLGGGPGGAAAAIYSSRKNLKVAVICTEPGGSVNLTGAIDNLISTRTTTGTKLAGELRDNLTHYGADLFTDRIITEVDVKGAVKTAVTIDGERFEAPQMIVVTGSRPRKCGVPGEQEYTGRGVAYCPHCDGPFFKGKDVAVIGGGNSGIEAAIDLAGMCRKVTVFEFLDTCRADEVLLSKAKSLANVEIHVSSKVLEMTGDGTRLTGVKVENREDGSVADYAVSGVFVQIGVLPNSELFTDKLELNRHGEIVTDRECRTSEAGVYAAGDVGNGPFKQIVTAIGEGATAALTAFNDRMRGE